jgi:hypothetical protein
VISPKEVEEMVASAAMYMDGVKPDWFLCIDPVTLDMMSVSRCVCGQNGLNFEEHGRKFGHGYVFAANQARGFWLDQIEKRTVTIPDAMPDRVLVTA